MRYYFEDDYGRREAALIAYTDASDAVMIAHTDTGINDCTVVTTSAYTPDDFGAVVDFADKYGADFIERR